MKILNKFSLFNATMSIVAPPWFTIAIALDVFGKHFAMFKMNNSKLATVNDKNKKFATQCAYWQSICNKPRRCIQWTQSGSPSCWLGTKHATLFGNSHQPRTHPV